MFETSNKIRQNDLEELAQNNIFDEFDSKSILITGATGLVGSELVLGILCANRLRSLNIKVIALVRNEEKAKKVFEKVLENPNLEIIVQDVNRPLTYEGKVDYIIHTANTTSSKDFVTKPVETIMTIINGTKNMLDYAKKVSAKSFLYLSSLEIYGTILSETPLKESEYGKLEILSSRNSYSEGKRLAENLCISYSYEYGLNTKIARLAQTFGAGVTKDDNRVFAQFAKSVINKTDIVLHTKGETVRNYCYITDAVSALLTILLKGKDQAAYNVANPNTAISIKDMAGIAAEKGGVEVKYEIDNKERGYNPIVKIILDTAELEKLGWEAWIDLDEMFERLILSMKMAEQL